MKKKNCKHYNLFIYRDLVFLHATEVAVRYGEDGQYEETQLKNDWSNDWNIKKYKKITVMCSECKKEWYGVTPLDFPNWIQDVLEHEEKYFERL